PECRIAVEDDAERPDAGFGVDTKTVTDDVGTTNQGRAETDRDRDAPARRVLITGEPEALHVADLVTVSLTLESLVVEVRGRRSHRAAGERVAVGVSASGRVDVVGELQAHGDGQVELVKGSSGLRRAFA